MLYGFGSIGFMLVFLLLFTVEPVNQAFWTSVNSILAALHISPNFARLGLSALMPGR
jgi:hypothetical protein